MLAAVFSGNSIVIKVSEHASWSGCFYVRIIQTALAAVGAPENLVEVITGFAQTGEALVSSVDETIFVGSPGVGKMYAWMEALLHTRLTRESGMEIEEKVDKKVRENVKLMMSKLAEKNPEPSVEPLTGDF